jgi:hypothetical protein
MYREASLELRIKIKTIKHAMTALPTFWDHVSLS